MAVGDRSTRTVIRDGSVPARVALDMQRADLPIFELEEKIIAALRGHSRLILQAPTGSGQIDASSADSARSWSAWRTAGSRSPAAAPRHPPSRVPRRRQNERAGSAMRSAIKFASRTSRSPRTRIRFITEGILLAAVDRRSRIARHVDDPVRRISRAPSLRRHHAGARVAVAGDNAARSENRGDVRHARDAAVAKVSRALRSPDFRRAPASRRDRISGEAGTR